MDNAPEPREKVDSPPEVEERIVEEGVPEQVEGRDG